MTNNMDRESTELTTRSNGILSRLSQTMKDWWRSLPPWGRTLVSLGAIGASTFVVHDALEHNCKPEIKIGNVLELTMTPKSLDWVDA